MEERYWKMNRVKEIIKLIYDILPFKKELFLLCKAVYRPPKHVYKHLHFKGVFNVNVKGKRIKMHHFGYQLENEIFWSGIKGEWEKASMSLWLDLCKMSNSVMDIGANTGIYALVAKTINPSAKVYAFEPVKRVCDKLKLNVKLNEYNITCEESAISSYDGKGIIYDQNTEHIYSVCVNKNMENSTTNVVKREINTIKLETYIKNKKIPKIDLIKIDVETHEAEVLEGMGDYLGKMQPTMITEVLNDEVGERIEKILNGKNYLYFNIDEKRFPYRVEHITKSKSYNYLICNKEIAQKLNLVYK